MTDEPWVECLLPTEYLLGAVQKLDLPYSGI